uniref:SURF1-like protein n=1 Tax=Steinernema glaseri TaxID=37863 RepID=A0A1I7ZRS3_9BILA
MNLEPREVPVIRVPWTGKPPMPPVGIRLLRSSKDRSPQRDAQNVNGERGWMKSDIVRLPVNSVARRASSALEMGEFVTLQPSYVRN